MFAFWIIFLAVTNTIFILTRIILLRKLRRIEKAETFMANYYLWSLFRSKTYKFDTNVYQFVLVIPSCFLAMFMLMKADCPHVIMYSPFVMLFFSGLCFLTGTPKLTFQEEVDIIEMFNGISIAKGKPFTIMKWGDYSKLVRKNNDSMCPICYEDYKEEVKIKFMDCPGNHAFHTHCIDKWIIKSDKCPMCNLTIFSNKKLE